MKKRYATVPEFETFQGKIVQLAYRLAPCPFCLSKDLTIADDNNAVKCQTCGAIGPSKYAYGGHFWNMWVDNQGTVSQRDTDITDLPFAEQDKINGQKEEKNTGSR